MIEGMGHTAGAYLYVLLPAILDMSLNRSEFTSTLPQSALLGVPDVIEKATDFEAFYTAVLQNIKKVITEVTQWQVTMGREQKRLNPCPLFSSTHQGCVENGADYTEGGAKYNLSTICVCGIATFIDSLYAIKEIVYERCELTLEQFAKILLLNWENAEDLQSLCLKLPKYGCGDERVDSLAHRVIEDMNSFITELTNERGGKNILSMFSYYLFRTFAPYVRATADGRRDGEFLSQGISSSRLIKNNSLAQLLETVKNADYTTLSGISVLDIMLTPDINEDLLSAVMKMRQPFLFEISIAFRLKVWYTVCIKFFTTMGPVIWKITFLNREISF